MGSLCSRYGRAGALHVVLNVELWAFAGHWQQSTHPKCRWRFTSSTGGQRPGTRQPVVITGWPEARSAIADALTAAGPDVALMGFSQGATAAAAYAAAAAADAALPAPRCVIAVAGFMPRDEHLAAAVQGTGVHVPAMHVIGASDEIIPRARSDELAAACKGPVTIHVHSGGHFVPTCTGACRSKCLEKDGLGSGMSACSSHARRTL